MRRPLLRAGLLAVLALVLAACRAPAQEEYADGIVAVVEGEPVTRHELELQCRLEPQWHQLPRGPSEARDALRRAQLDRLVELRILLAIAKEQKLALTPQDEARVQSTIERIAEQYRGINGLRQLIEGEMGVPWEAFVAMQRELALRHKLLMSSVSRDIFPTPDEIRRYYEAHRSEFVRAGETRLRRIVVFKDPDDGMRLSAPLRALVQQGGFDAATLMADLRARIARGELAFEDAQRQWSQDQTYDKEEVYPSNVPLRELLRPEALADQVARLQPGEASGVIDAGRQGLVLVLLLDRQAEGRVPLADVQERIELTIKEDEWRRRQNDWIATRRADAHVELFVPPPGNK